jgi:cysteinyl-tRNA synthetase
MDLSWASLEAAHTTLRRWRKVMAEWGTSAELKFDQEIVDALTNDLDTPRAMQRLRTIEKDSTIGALDKRAIFLFADQVLGLDLARTEQHKALTPELAQLLENRAQARADKNWAESDALRSKLEESGLEIKDGPTGQTWSWR